jgi:hypothetical protein
MATPETINKIRIMLGASITDCEIDDVTIETCVEIAEGRYHRGVYKLSVGSAESWIMDYAIANCKLVLAEFRMKVMAEGGEALASIAIYRMNELENEIKGI